MSESSTNTESTDISLSAADIQRAAVFGALGVYGYLGHLAYRVFQDSVLFPFVLALLGLSMILATVWVQKRMRRVMASS
jgi:hypothetical protein